MRATIFSCCYRIVRHTLSKVLFFIQRVSNGHTDLESLVEVGDTVLRGIHDSPFKSISFQFPKKSLKKDLFDLAFASPLTFSSFKDDLTLIRIWKELGIGGGVLKTIMPNAQNGNQRPRMQEVTIDGKLGFINALGLPGKGVTSLLETVQDSGLLNELPLGFSVGGNTVSDYLNTVQEIDTWRQKISLDTMYYELNISCPNTDHGRSLADDVVALEGLLKDIREFSNRVIVVKVSPDQTDKTLQTFAEMISSIDKCAINAGNTQFRTRESLGFSEKQFTRPGGGLSGPSLFKRTREMLQLLKSFNVPIISTGGVSTRDDVRTLLNEGATLVGMASQLVKDPYSIPKINKSLV
jgi:dihydroorotate dehydrogenase